MTSRRFTCLSQSFEKLIVIRVRAKPKPNDQIPMVAPLGPEALVDSHRPDVRNERFELQRRGEGILLPATVFLPRQMLNLRR